MMPNTYGLFIGGEWEAPGETIAVNHKYIGEPVGYVARPPGPMCGGRSMRRRPPSS